MNESEINKLPAIIGINEIRLIFGIGRDTAYKLVKREGFPKPLLERPLRFSKQAVLKWAKVNL